MNECEICLSEYEKTGNNQKYCEECGKDPERMRKHYRVAEYINKVHAGDLYKPIESTCIECNKKIISIYSKRFCGTACSEIHRARTAKCPICMNLLADYKINSGRGFCSDECKKISQKQKAIENGHYIPCETCGKKFIRKTYSNRFCSRTCFRVDEIKRNEEKKRASLLNPRKTTEQRKCKTCGNEFEWNIKRPSQKFCSRECSHEHSRIVAREKREEVKKQIEIRKDLHLCTTCRTSQIDCERFTSNFVYMPTGAKKKEINGKFIIVSCPKFK